MTNCLDRQPPTPPSRDPSGSQRQNLQSLLGSTSILKKSQESLETMSQVKLGPFPQESPQSPLGPRLGLGLPFSVK